MTLTFKNFQLKTFSEFLYELTLKGKDSRMRTRFLRLLEDQLNLITKEHEQLAMDYAKREDGEVVYDKDSKGREFIALDNPAAFNAEVAELMNEELIIELTPDKVEMIKSVQESVLNADIELSKEKAVYYDTFCEILESVNFDVK